MKNQLYYIFFFMVALVGCDGGNPSVQFSEPIDGKQIDLRDYLNEAFSVLRYEDTVAYEVSYNPKTKENLITSRNDTVFLGTAIKRRELLLLNRELDNNNFIIHALKISDHTITGLETEWDQTQILDSLMETKKYNKLVSDTTKHKTVEASKRDGKRIFREVIALLPAERIIKNKPTEVAAYNNDTSRTISPTQKTDNTLIESLYPNPIEDKVFLTLKSEEVYFIEFRDQTGHVISSTESYGKSFEFDLSTAPSGLIILTIDQKNLKTPEVTQLFKN